MTYILCTDLDRTLIPNGHLPPDPNAIPTLHALLNQIDLTLIYVSGRDIKLVQQAIEKYQLPFPNYAITDVGSQIYQLNKSSWQQNTDWYQTLQQYWDEQKIITIKDELPKIDGVVSQEPEKQSDFKASYYFSTDLDLLKLNDTVEQICKRANFHANIIISIDETTDTGLLDIIPDHASKYLALKFLARQHDYNIDRLVYSGDSGNDMSVLSSSLNAILVNNTETEIKQQVIQLSEQNNFRKHIYLAKGNFTGLNGNYCSGILEGLAYYFPELENTIQQQLVKSTTS